MLSGMDIKGALTMMDRNCYRRQFLLARHPVAELEGWDLRNVGKYCLHTHPDLPITEASDSSRKLILLGYLFDTEKYESSNQDILRRILAGTSDFFSLLRELKCYTGRFAIIYRDQSGLRLLHDALALREVYFAEYGNEVVCGSQPNLLERFANPRIHKSAAPDLLDFVLNQMPRVRNGRLWAGDGTPYEGIKHLLPNHYLDLVGMKSYRYWPSEPLKRIELSDAVSRCAAFLSGALKAAAHRYPLMLAVTAGEDSRSLLAASKDISSQIYYFINKHDGLRDQSSDIRVPKEIFRRIGIPFNIHQFSKDVPDEYKRTFLQNTIYSREQLLPVIYNVYQKQHSHRVNILGVGEVGRTKFFDEPRKLSPYYLAYMLRYRKSPYAVRECKSWLAEASPAARSCGLNIMTLFWWEILIGNWGAVGNSESDIAIEEFDPFDSHLLYEMFLSVDAKYRTFKNNILFRELIKFMWPELLELPFNPPDSKKDRVITVLNKFGVENALRMMKARLYGWYYRLFWAQKKRAR